MQTHQPRHPAYTLAHGLALASFALIAASGAGCKKKAGTNATTVGAPAGAGEILVGEVGSLTGSEATFGTSTHQAIELAFKKLNEAGGIHGKQLRLVTLDDQSKAEEAATAVTKLITQNGVRAILGEVASSRSLAMAPIAQSHKVPMITPSSVNPKVTEQGDYVFRVCFIDSFQGGVMAKFAKDTLKLKKIAVLRDVKNDYSVGLAGAFVDSFKKAGGEIVIDQSYSSGDIDFKSQLTSIRAKSPEAVYIPGYYTEVGLIARQARDLGLQVPLLGGDAWDSPKLTEISGPALNGAYFSTHFSAEDKTPMVQEFIKSYKAAYGQTPDGIAATAYDAAQVLADALKRAKTEAPGDLRDAIAATRDFPGVTGRITLNEKRDAIKPAVMIRIEGGEVKYSGTVQP